MVNRAVTSSWIARLSYVPKAPDVQMPVGTDGFLIVETQAGDKYAWAVPAFVPGLLCAAKSPGRMFGRLVRGRWPSVKITA